MALDCWSLFPCKFPAQPEIAQRRGQHRAGVFQTFRFRLSAQLDRLRSWAETFFSCRKLEEWRSGRDGDCPKEHLRQHQPAPVQTSWVKDDRKWSGMTERERKKSERTEPYNFESISVGETSKRFPWMRVWWGLPCFERWGIDDLLPVWIYWIFIVCIMDLASGPVPREWWGLNSICVILERVGFYLGNSTRDPFSFLLTVIIEFIWFINSPQCKASSKWMCNEEIPYTILHNVGLIKFSCKWETFRLRKKDLSNKTG